MQIEARKLCPDCHAKIGAPHAHWCDVAQCSHCGGQRLSCCCSGKVKALPWSGLWPGQLDCIRLELFARPTHNGWEPCDATDPRATPDLNRLHLYGVWNKKLKCFDRKKNSPRN